jgi:putative glutamine amidotransferase
MKKPIIGITLDLEQEGSFSRYPYYAMRKNYFDMVIKAGGLPIALPYSQNKSVHDYFQLIDGLLIPGGDFDIPPEMYGEEQHPKVVLLKRDRTNFEAELAKLCLSENKPLLGICGGMQLINVVTGGSLIQDIPSQVEDSVAHQVKDRDSEAHRAIIKLESKLNKITGKAEIGVNTAHHQAVKELGECVINAIAEDGIIEGIEHPNHKYCIGVQWHPEYEVSDADYKIIESFVAACKN